MAENNRPSRDLDEIYGIADIHDLKSCPFCGGKARVLKTRGKKYLVPSVRCKVCHATVPLLRAESRISSHTKTKKGESVEEMLMIRYGKGLVKIWNRRAKHD